MAEDTKQSDGGAKAELVNAIFASTDKTAERPFVLVSAKIRPESERKAEVLYEGFEIKHHSEHRSLDEAQMHAELLGLANLKTLCFEDGRPMGAYQQTLSAALMKSILTTKLIKNHQFLAPTMLNIARVVDQIAEKTVDNEEDSEEAFNVIADDMISRAFLGYFL